MSYSSACQGLQSSVVEPRVLKLKLTPANEEPHENKNSQPWSFLQSLSNISHCKEHKTNNVYVHPSVKRSSSMLSAKSLELCTESLGCETGSNAGDNTDEVSLFSLESNLRSNKTPLVKKNYGSKRLNCATNFPPPLTSMGGIKVRSHREDGRLVLEAVTSSSPQPYFEAERGNGRLRLRLFESVETCCGDDGGETETLNNEGWGEEDAELDEYVGYGEDEMGVKKFVRLSRCKESGNRVIFGDGYFEHPPLSLCL